MISGLSEVSGLLDCDWRGNVDGAVKAAADLNKRRRGALCAEQGQCVGDEDSPLLLLN